MDLDEKQKNEKPEKDFKVNKRLIMILLSIVVVVIVVWGAYKFWFISTNNSFVETEEPIATAWGNVETEYQSRADKVKVIAKIIKNSANFEKGTLVEVVEARAKATSINLDMKDLTPENMAKFEKAQGQLTGALSRLMMNVERYPDLKTTAAFRDFQAQYEGIENRITKARRDFNSAIKPYNIMVKKFPSSIVAEKKNYTTKPYFKSSPGAENAPVDIDLGFDK